MNILEKGSQGQQVAELQHVLKKQGYSIHSDGIFGQQTYIAVCEIQKKYGLLVDGKVGEETRKVINGLTEKVTAQPPAAEKVAVVPPQDKQHGILDYAATVQILGVEEAAVWAVCEVESGGKLGFLKDGRPIILFEGHIFWNELKKKGIDPGKYSSESGDVLFPKWNRASYVGGIAEYDRLEKASRINKDAALCSASWGMFQIMGFNHKICGFGTVRDYVEAIKQSANNHLVSFIEYLKNTELAKPLKELDWDTFAKRYNGSGYKQNQYDRKLKAAYLKYKKIL